MDTDPTLPNQEEESSQVVPLDRPENIYDQDDEFSVINLVTDRLRQAILAVPPELMDLEEGELRAKCKPSQQEFQLRVSFWREFEKIFARGKKRITSREVFGGICSEGHFYRFLQDPVKVAWLVRPMEAYDKQIEAISLLMLDKLWKIADMELEDPKTGKISSKKADLFLRVYKEVVARKKTMNVKHVIKDQRALPPGAPKQVTSPSQVIPSSLKDINRRIAELDAEKKGIVANPPTIDVPASAPAKTDAEVEIF